MHQTHHSKHMRSAIPRWVSAAGLSMIAFALTSSPAFAQSATSIATQACQTYKDMMITTLTLTEQGLLDANENSQPEVRITQRITQEIRRDTLQGFIDQEPNAELQRIMTRAANRFVTTGRIETFQQELRPFDATCPTVMAQRLAESAPDQRPPQPLPAIYGNQGQMSEREQARPKEGTSGRLMLPESTPLRR